MQPTTLHNSRIHPKPFIHPHPNPHPHQTQASTATTRTQQQQHPKNQPRRAPESRRAIHNSPTHPAQPLQTLTSSSVKPHPKSHFPRPRRPHRKRTSRRANSPRKSTHSQHNRAATSTAQIFVRLRRPAGTPTCATTKRYRHEEGRYAELRLSNHTRSQKDQPVSGAVSKCGHEALDGAENVSRHFACKNHERTQSADTPAPLT